MKDRLVAAASAVVLAVSAILLPAPHARAARNANGVWAVLDVGATKPPARKHHTMVYDPVYNRVIMFAGETEVNGQDVVLSDLWKLDLDGPTPQWTQLTSAAEGRHGHSAAYGNGKMYVVCGFSNMSGTYAGSGLLLNLGTTPSWGTSFGLPTGQQADICLDEFGNPFPEEYFELRAHSAAAYLDRLYFMGGRSGAQNDRILHDVWGYDGSAWDWRSGLTGTGEGYDPQRKNLCALHQPTFRYWHSMITAGEKIVVFGGAYLTVGNGLTASSEDGISWTALEPGPSARMFHAAVYDEQGDRMVVTGGYTQPDPKDGILKDVIALAHPDSVGGAWSTLSYSPQDGGPGFIAEHAAVYDPEGDRVIVFGGVTTNEVLRGNDTYVLAFEPPPAAATLIGSRGKTTATISWTAPGDDGTTGTAAEYDLRRSTATITPANFLSATQITTSSPQAAGSSECVEVSGLTACQKYYYALKTRDTAGNWSAMSNILSLTQKCSGGEVICVGSSGSIGGEGLPQIVSFAIRGSNPSSAGTTLVVGVAADRQGQPLEITICDVSGARVRTLARRTATLGEATYVWDHRTDAGVKVARGVYYARLQLGEEIRTQKVVVSVGR